MNLVKKILAIIISGVGLLATLLLLRTSRILSSCSWTTSAGASLGSTAAASFVARQHRGSIK